VCRERFALSPKGGSTRPRKPPPKVRSASFSMQPDGV
jgi:hypothetical protein